MKIQKIADYIKKRKKVKRSLNISTRKISKVSQGLEEEGNIYENIIYFNKDLIVADVLVPLFPVGVDKTTLTIDLKDRRAKIYVEELDLKQEDF